MQVVFKKLGNKDLVNWITNEIKGYKDSKLPDYRMLRGQVYGTVTNGHFIQYSSGDNLNDIKDRNITTN